MEELRKNGMRLERITSSEMQVRGGSVDWKSIFTVIRYVATAILTYMSDFINGFNAGKKAV
ncbi:MAG: hypothetical protein HUJ92_04135 [Bacteroidales bacterium]|nr:hypothetical protein [Bacteroidales bacterium]